MSRCLLFFVWNASIIKLLFNLELVIERKKICLICQYILTEGKGAQKTVK